MKKTLRLITRFTGVLLAGIMAVSCTTPKDITYFQDLKEDTVVELANRKAIKLQPDDKLTITVSSKDAALSDLFNLTYGVTRSSSNSGSINGTGTNTRSYSTTDNLASYTVSPSGDIDFPVLGKLHVAGMTRSELAGFIKGELMGRDLVKDPIVTVEFLSTGFSVLGEVAHPGRFDMNRDEINVLQAISLAGDLTINGMREKVLLLREENGKIQSYRLNLTDLNQMTNSPAFYLQQDDVIYVEPDGMKKRSTTVNGNNVLNASFWMSVASFATTVAVLIFK